MTQARKTQQLVSMMPGLKKAFGLLGDVIVDLSTKNESLEIKKGSYHEKG